MFAEIPADKLYYVLPLLLLPILPNLWGIIHAARRDFPTPQERAAWLTALVILPVIGGLVYMFFGVRRAVKKN
jgi:hypothetical protein